MKPWTIGWLASEGGVRVDTIRYYERRGLLPRPSRRHSGYRQYTEDDLARVRFIRRAKDLGFSLAEIAELLELRVDHLKTCADVRREADRKAGDIDRRIGELQRMRLALVEVAAACRGRGPTSECPILEALEQRPVAGGKDARPDRHTAKAE